MTAPVGLYKVALRMAHDTTWPQRRKWSTTFVVSATTATTAANLVAGWWADYLRTAADSTVFAYEVYATSLVAGDDDYRVLPFAQGDQRGTRVQVPGDQQYLAKTVLTVELLVASGRPSRKFWRFGLWERDVVQGVAVIEDVLLRTRAAFENVLDSAGASLVDPDGQRIVGVGKIRLSTREFGRTAGNEVPSPPVG